MSRNQHIAGRRSYNLPGHAHELTFSTYRRLPFLRAERCCAWLADALATAREKQAFSVWAFVFMPEHVHLLVFPFAPQYNIGRILESIKRPVGVHAFAFLEECDSPWLPHLTRRRGKRTERLFWQSGGGYDRNITSPRTLLAAIDYIHLNPIRKGLVSQAIDWRWSSAGHYQGGTSPIPIDPIPPAWLDAEVST